MVLKNYLEFHADRWMIGSKPSLKRDPTLVQEVLETQPSIGNSYSFKEPPNTTFNFVPMDLKARGGTGHRTRTKGKRSGRANRKTERGTFRALETEVLVTKFIVTTEDKERFL